MYRVLRAFVVVSFGLVILGVTIATLVARAGSRAQVLVDSLKLILLQDLELLLLLCVVALLLSARGRPTALVVLGDGTQVVFGVLSRVPTLVFLDHVT